MATITVRTRSYDTPTSATADAAAKAARDIGLRVRHDHQRDPHNRRWTRHRLTITGDTDILEMIVPDLRKLGIRPVIHP